MKIPSACRSIAESDWFEQVILFLIVLNALALGLETSEPLALQYDDLLSWIFILSQLIFVVEISIRLVAFLPNLKNFFRDFWNSFDFFIVVAALVPEVGAIAFVARIFRVLRVLRIVSVSDELREFLSGMRCSVVVLLMSAIVWGVVSYAFAVAGVFLFGQIDPNSWGSLPSAFKTILYLSLFQDIPKVVDIQLQSSWGSIVYFLLFYGALISFGFNLLATIVREHINTSGSPNDD